MTRCGMSCKCQALGGPCLVSGMHVGWAKTQKVMCHAVSVVSESVCDALCKFQALVVLVKCLVRMLDGQEGRK